jgi:AcrR family transcriptional regulator
MAKLRDEHVEATKRAVLDAARRRFGERGFGGTSLDDVAADAGVTKGALYHHFGSKERLFLRVYDEVEAELSAEGMAGAADASDPVDALRRAFAAFLDRALDPAVQRIAILDAPSVLGTTAKQEVDARHSLAAVRAAVEAGMDDGLIARLEPGAIAQLLIAACSQAALLIATAADHTRARADAGAALDRLITGLAPS